MGKEQADPFYRCELGDGLVLRWSTSVDTPALARLVSQVFREREDAPPNTFLERLVEELMSGAHPLMGPGDFAVVEDQSRQEHPLVACTCLWRHTWEYEGVAFGVGRPEIVASDPAYRHRGLVRALFELIHARSEAEGHLVQGITGIPYFYRLFGYEYALHLGGSRTTLVSQIPPAQEGEGSEVYTLRDAMWEDLPLVQHLYDQRRAEGIVSMQLNEAWWRYHFANWSSSLAGAHWHIQIILNRQKQPQGYLITQAKRWQKSLPVTDMAFVRGTNVQAMVLPLLRALADQGKDLPSREAESEPFTQISFDLGGAHPWYEVLNKDLTGTQEAPYAWYLRVANLPGFLWHIAPVLERRLASSLVAGYSGELTLDFYRGGLRLVFERGKLITAENWQCPIWSVRPEIRFPPLTFLQVLFGYRDLDALRASLPDVRVSESKEILLRALFPTRASWVFD
jgi:hypothetical protein